MYFSSDYYSFLPITEYYQYTELCLKQRHSLKDLRVPKADVASCYDFKVSLKNTEINHYKNQPGKKKKLQDKLACFLLFIASVQERNKTQCLWFTLPTVLPAHLGKNLAVKTALFLPVLCFSQQPSWSSQKCFSDIVSFSEDKRRK